MCAKSGISLQYSYGTVRPNCGPNKAYLAADAIQNKEIWKKYSHAFRAEYASDWDCGVESSYWYVIKDVPFDVNALKAKRRYEITKGNRNFAVRRINVKDELDGMYDVYTEAIIGYKLLSPPSPGTLKNNLFVV